MTEAYEQFKKIPQEPSEDMMYRYRLHRSCSGDSTVPVEEMEKKTLCFILLNPSTAVGDDSSKNKVNDPTVNRCMKLACKWHYACIEIVNLYALRATNPMLLIDACQPVGDRNDAYLELVSKSDMDCVAAWGEKYGPQRVLDVLKIFEDRLGGKPLKCIYKPSKPDAYLKPRHPLRCSNDCELRDWPVNSCAYCEYKNNAKKIVDSFLEMRSPNS